MRRVMREAASQATSHGRMASHRAAAAPLSRSCRALRPAPQPLAPLTKRTRLLKCQCSHHTNSAPYCAQGPAGSSQKPMLEADPPGRRHRSCEASPACRGCACGRARGGGGGGGSPVAGGAAQADGAGGPAGVDAQGASRAAHGGVPLQSSGAHAQQVRPLRPIITPRGGPHQRLPYRAGPALHRRGVSCI